VKCYNYETFVCFTVNAVDGIEFCIFAHISVTERHFVITQHPSVYMCSVFAAVQSVRMVLEAESLLKFLQLTLHGCMCHKVFHSCQM
jgi:hypothetical protein